MENKDLVYSINTVYGDFESGVAVYRMTGSFSGWYEIIDYINGISCMTCTKNAAIDIANAIARDQKNGVKK